MTDHTKLQAANHSGKPDGAVRQLEREAHPGDHINLLKAVVAFCDTDVIQKITTFVIEQREATLHSPKIAAETCPTCNGTRESLRFSEQGWVHETKPCPVCREGKIAATKPSHIPL